MTKGSAVFVTGGTGFLGSHLVRRLVHDGFDVHLLCRENSDFWRLPDLLPQVDRHVSPLEDGVRLREIVTAIQPQAIFHLASATVVAGRTGAAEQLVTSNLLGTINLLDACESVDYKALIVAGDSFEYAPTHGLLSESDCCRPANLHGISKFAATLYAQSIAASRDRPITVLRLFSTYGPFDNPRRLVPRMIAASLAGTPLSLSRPDIVRDWVYIDDVIELLMQAAANAPENSGSVFNAGSGIFTDLKTLVDLIQRLTGSGIEPAWGTFTAPEHDSYPWVADTRRTFERFAWRPATGLEAGLRATIAAMSTP